MVEMALPLAALGAAVAPVTSSQVFVMCFWIRSAALAPAGAPTMSAKSAAASGGRMALSPLGRHIVAPRGGRAGGGPEERGGFPPLSPGPSPPLPQPEADVLPWPLSGCASQPSGVWGAIGGLGSRAPMALGGRSGGGGGTAAFKHLTGGGAGSAATRLVAAPPAGASVLPLARWDPGRGMWYTGRVGFDSRLYRI